MAIKIRKEKTLLFPELKSSKNRDAKRDAKEETQKRR